MPVSVSPMYRPSRVPKPTELMPTKLASVALSVQRGGMGGIRGRFGLRGNGGGEGVGGGNGGTKGGGGEGLG